MTIYCRTDAEFYAAIEQCVKRGLTFEAHADSLQIKLLGGFSP